jgi:hypothetical protein
MKVCCGLLAGAILTLGVPAYAQSLGELAKKEQERRKASPPPAKVYTNDDLKKIYMPAGAADAAGKDAKESKDGKDPDGKDPKDAKAAKDTKDPAAPVMDETAWRARMTQAREDVRRGEMFRDALQSRINGLTADFTARDDPYQRAQIADERQKALAELTQVNTDIEKAKKQIADIEEDARKANVPPGWIR